MLFPNQMVQIHTEHSQKHFKIFLNVYAGFSCLLFKLPANWGVSPISVCARSTCKKNPSCS